MDKWPNLKCLSNATEEEVRDAWKGLGYYSRAKRLWEGSKLLVNQYDGAFPSTSKELKNILPGVGPYTACAIASIVNGEQCGVVDGNVIRVLCRLRIIGGDVTTTRVKDVLWELVNSLVLPESPGDFNQAIMELGATVCTPQAPLCGDCPINSVCSAHLNLSLHQNIDETSKNSIETFFTKETAKNNSNDFKCDIEDIDGCGIYRKSNSSNIQCVDDCTLCLPQNNYIAALGVTNYPVKIARKPPKLEYFAVCLFETSGTNTSSESDKRQFLLVKRPETGLLANLLEFPSIQLENSEDSNQKFEDLINNENIKIKTTYLGIVTHVFSHLLHTYSVYHAMLLQSTVVEQITEYFSKLNKERGVKWLTLSEIQHTSISTGMHKVLDLLITKEDYVISNNKMTRKREKSTTEKSPKNAKRQKTMNSYFVKK